MRYTTGSYDYNRLREAVDQFVANGGNRLTFFVIPSHIDPNGTTKGYVEYDAPVGDAPDTGSEIDRIYRSLA